MLGFLIFSAVVGALIGVGKLAYMLGFNGVVKMLRNGGLQTFGLTALLGAITYGTIIFGVFLGLASQR